MNNFRELSGLPLYGSLPERYCLDEHEFLSEGYVVEFLPDSKEKWVGNFQAGLSSLNAVFDHPNGEDVIVISGGECYVVSPITKELKLKLGGQIESYKFTKEHSLLVLCSPFNIEILYSNGKHCSTKRISWDGIQDITIDDRVLIGKAYCPMTDKWISFEVNLLDGSHKGGSFID